MTIWGFATNMIHLKRRINEQLTMQSPNDEAGFVMWRRKKLYPSRRCHNNIKMNVANMNKNNNLVSKRMLLTHHAYAKLKHRYNNIYKSHINASGRKHKVSFAAILWSFYLSWKWGQTLAGRKKNEPRRKEAMMMMAINNHKKTHPQWCHPAFLHSYEPFNLWQVSGGETVGERMTHSSKNAGLNKVQNCSIKQSTVRSLNTLSTNVKLI